ncbi:MAG: hypothetical protein J6N15_09060 [Ruminiclostridium sp.]|nr:hypothetical protein [Ruminiclostridium sp.]
MEHRSAVLIFDSFDGGGPEYRIITDSDIFTYTSVRKYSDPNHDELDGAGYTITYTFTGTRPGTADITVTERSFDGECSHRFTVNVDDALNVTIETSESGST